MSASTEAKRLGASGVTEVAEFYGVSRNHLHKMYNNQPRCFVAMVLGRVEYQRRLEIKKQPGDLV